MGEIAVAVIITTEIRITDKTILLIPVAPFLNV